MGLRATLTFRKFKVALNPMLQNLFRLRQKFHLILVIKLNSIIGKKFTVPFLKYKRLKLKLRVFLAGHSVATVTYCVTKIISTCSPVIGLFFKAMIVASID